MMCINHVKCPKIISQAADYYSLSLSILSPFVIVMIGMVAPETSTTRVPKCVVAVVVDAKILAGQLGW